ncbi:hypothetical protein [Bradyrhizobium sp. LA2.1]|uniref:hypothetical protein n=1 Tax=Bradyrhizobium sp. LA2.1 TaxID=3156376 RepID=UPI0033976D3D
MRWNIASVFEMLFERGRSFGVLAHQSPLSSPDLIGRSSIPEAAVIEPKGRGVLDAPVKPGHDSGGCG